MSAITYTLDKSKMGLYTRIPRKFSRKGYRGSMVGILAKIFTFSTPKNGEEPICRLSYNQIEEEFGYTAPTISKALAELKEEGCIEAVVRDKDGTGYRYVSEEKPGRLYDVIPQYLYTQEFDFGGKQRRLKPTELRLLARIMTDVDRSGGYEKGVSSASMSQYASDLGVAKVTIKKAIRNLLRAKLIYRPKEDKGTWKKNVSVYHANKKLFVYKDYIKRPKAAKKGHKSPEIEALDAKADREQFYARRREKALNAADKANKKVKQNPEYRDIAEKLSKMGILEARAELYNPLKLPQIQAQKRDLERARSELLRILGVEEADLHPKFCCSKCEDTGFLPGGQACDCYQKE